MVEVRHKNSGYVTRYAHLSKIPNTTRRGRTVKRGDLIAYSGNTGYSFAPHLHFQVNRYDAEGKVVESVPFRFRDGTPQGALPEHSAFVSLRPKTTVELQLRFIRPATDGELAAHTRVVKKGRTIVHLDSQITDQDDRLIATATGTFTVLSP